MAQWGGRPGTEAVAISFSFLALASIILSLRLFTRVVLVRNYGFDDMVITAAFALSTACAVLVLVEVQHGQGLPEAVLSPSDLFYLEKTLWKSIPCYLAGLTMIKLSILLQYKRLFKGRSIHRFVVMMIVFVCVYGTWSVLGSLFLCTPVQFFWDHSIPNGSCISREAKWFSDAAINICTDFILLGIPMPFLKSLNLPKRQKRGLIAVFALGGFVCLVSIARLRPLYVISTANDVSKDNAPAAWLSSMELNVGIVCASLPSLRAITVRTCSRNSASFDPHTSDDGPPSNWWPFGKQDEAVIIEDGSEQNMCESTITKVVTIQTDTERRDSGRKMSIWSLGGGIWDGGAAKAWVRSGK